VELNGEVIIAAARPRVWAALNDPDMLARCIDGVETLVRVAGDAGERFEGKMNAKVGPVRASFSGQVTLTDVVEPESYVLVGEGKGGVAGFAKGEAAVTLIETAPTETLLRYAVKSSVGGKLAQLGGRLIEGTARGYAESFFGKLKAELETTTPDAATEAPQPMPAPGAADAVRAIPETASAPASRGGGLPPLVWSGGLIVLVLLFLLWQWN
jgi:carbon monoxide dehydrogenase subunit G